ncbi:MAG: hypothetical protein J6C46_06445 [Clostridia bacterium]|nr:hypothetical protein [Clostridia bacterium]
MQTNIFSLIDQLVSMSGSTTNFDTLDSELTLIETEIPKLSSEINELESSMTDDKYFDASQEIVDRNIELSVNKKLNKLEKEFNILQSEQAILQAKEKQHIEAIDLLKQKILKAKKTISIIEARLEKTNADDTKNIYSGIYEEEIEKVNILQTRLEERNSVLENISNDVDIINDKVSKIKKEIEQSTSRLMEVRRSLNNKNNYIDETLKNKDDENIRNLQKRLIDLEAKKLTILTDATYIASEVKELFIAEQNSKAMQKLMELVTIVNSKPYMEISDRDSLELELSKLEASQNDLINVIENKEYYGNDVVYLDNRITHLRRLIEAKKDEIEAIRRKIFEIDNHLVLEITNELKNAENESEKLEKSISDYEELIKSSEKKSSNIIVSLQASYNKKTNELKVIRDIIDRYSKELGLLVETSSRLEEVKITKLENEISKYKDEIEDLTKIKLMSTKTKDAIEQENDKQKLKNIADSINILKQRLDYGKTPQEIYDEIEMYIDSSASNMSFSENSEISDLKEHYFDEAEVSIPKDLEDPFNNQEYVEEEKDNNENLTINNYNVIDELDLEDITSEEIKDNEVFDDDKLDKFEFSELQERDNIFLDEKDTEFSEDKNNEEEYTFSELEDTDYFSLDEFLKNLDERKED